jgi:NAD-dependent dihydropyrimidine dehydrogenase PreA subunit/ferredoxin
MPVESTSTKTNVVTLTIDGVEVKTTKGKRILEAALDNNIYIPNLCSLRDIRLPYGACRLCQVQIEGRKGFVTACSEPAAEGMIIHSNTPEVNAMRRKILHIMLARHPFVCLECHRRERCKPGDTCLRLISVNEQQCILCPNNGRCEVQRAVDFIGLGEMPYPYTHKGYHIERENPFIVRNNNLCILCGRCVRVDQEILGIEAISFNRRGRDTFIGGAFGRPLLESGCTFCGCCVEVCPTGALKNVGDEWERWPDPKAASIRCQYNCPARVNVPRFIRFIRERKYNEALAVIQEKVPFALICSRICSHPCESACRRNGLDQGLAIRALERFAAERASVKLTLEGKAPASGKKVAIVGSGSAGLTAAYYLAKKGGHAVTVFESEPQAGGMLRTAPEYDLPRQILDDELEMLKRLGIEIKTQAKVESVDKLFNDGFQAVFVAGDAPKMAELGITVSSDGLGTGKKGVFAVSKAVSDKHIFIKGVAAGRKAAITIDRYLGGSGNIDEVLAPVQEGIPRIGRMPNFAQRKRVTMPTASVEQGKGESAKVELGFSDEAGSEEALRCMSCDLRFMVAKFVAQPPLSASKAGKH